MFWNIFAFLVGCGVSIYNFVAAKSVVWGVATGIIALWQGFVAGKGILDWYKNHDAAKQLAHEAEVERAAQAMAKKMVEDEKKKKAAEEEHRRRQEESEQRIAEAAARIVVEKMKKEG